MKEDSKLKYNDFDFKEMPTRMSFIKSISKKSPFTNTNKIKDFRSNRNNSQISKDFSLDIFPGKHSP